MLPIDSMLPSDISKPTRNQESWFVNATERFLKAGAASVGLGGGKVSEGAATIVDRQWLRKINLTVYDAVANPSLGNIPPGEEGNYGGGGFPAEASGSSGVGASASASRSANLATGKTGSEGIDLSEMRINFRLKKGLTGVPNMLEARVYNLSPDTIKRVRQYGRVQLAAGYESNFGMIFDGTVLLYIIGKENPVDSYIDIRAGDLDELNNGAVALTFPAGTTLEEKAKKMLKAVGATVGEIKLGDAGKIKNLRSSSFIGMLYEGMRDITNATQSDFYMDNGTVHVISWAGYRRNQLVELATDTGLVNIPKVTPQGIEAECLLNPKLRLGSLVKIDTGLISDIPYEPGASGPFSDKMGNLQSAQGVAAGGRAFKYPAASVNKTEGRGAGIYKICLLDHRGDTRGNTWYSYLVCAAAGANGEVISTSFEGTAYKRSMVNADPTKGT